MFTKEKNTDKRHLSVCPQVHKQHFCVFLCVSWFVFVGFVSCVAAVSPVGVMGDVYINGPDPPRVSGCVFILASLCLTLFNM